MLCIFRANTFVNPSWMCKKQTAITHSSAESEIIALHARLREVEYQRCILCDFVSENLANSPTGGHTLYQRNETRGTFDVDFVLSNILDSSHVTKFFIFDDNAAVIQKIN